MNMENSTDQKIPSDTEILDFLETCHGVKFNTVGKLKGTVEIHATINTTTIDRTLRKAAIQTMKRLGRIK